MTKFIEFPVKVSQGDKSETILINPKWITSIKTAYDGVGCYVQSSSDHNIINLTREEILNLIKQSEQENPYRTK